MQEIKRLDLAHFESLDRQILELSRNVEEKQHELEETQKQLEKNRKSFSLGKLAKESFEYNQIKLSKESERLKIEINEDVNEALLTLNNLENLLKEQEFPVVEHRVETPKVKKKVHKTHKAKKVKKKVKHKKTVKHKVVHKKKVHKAKVKHKKKTVKKKRRGKR